MLKPLRFATVIAALTTIVAIAAAATSLTACQCADEQGNPVDCKL